MNTVKQNVIKTLKGKKVLFLENDNELANGLENFEAILKEGGIKYNVLFKLQEKPIDDVLAEILATDAIVFQTQWMYDISKKLREFMFSLKEKKIAIEVYINEPTWYYKPDVVHDVYIFNQLRAEWMEPKFFKLSKKAYWDYKNKFDK